MKRQPCEKDLEMLKTHASILSEVPVDPFTPDDSDVEEADNESSSKHLRNVFERYMLETM